MSTVALVTGGNQGLGLALVRGLCRAWPAGEVYLLARDRPRGERAVATLAAEGLSPRLAMLDVRDDDSVRRLADNLAERHGGVDIVLSNAAARISPDQPAGDQIRTFLDTNNPGTHRMMAAFEPILRDGGRFVVVASSFGTLANLPAPLHHHFEDGVSIVDIERSLDGYAGLVETGEAVAAGWPDWMNIPSKVGQVAAVRALVRALGDGAVARDILINAACPGLVDTDASRPWFDDMSQAQSPDEAAADVLWLAMLPAGTRAPHGELVRHREVVPFNPPTRNVVA